MVYVLTMMTELIEKLPRVSTGPGVYLMKDAGGKVIYVGKAANLKKRLTSYFKNRNGKDLKTGILVKKIATFETLLTQTENEALILESNLIKRHRPRYNVILKDDKRYPSLRLDVQNPFPALSIVRKPETDGALYFGPFSSANGARQTLHFIEKTFGLRKCRNRRLKERTRPCINYQMGACLAPCSKQVDPETYGAIVREVILFLRGRTPELVRTLKARMAAAAGERDFEAAAVLRDRMFALQRTLEKQVAVTTDFQDRDVLATVRDENLSLVTLLSVRGGYLMGMRHFRFEEALASPEEAIAAFIRQYYESNRFIPNEVLTPAALEEGDLLAERLTAAKGRRVHVLWPRRGERAALLRMAQENARDALEEWITERSADIGLLTRVQKRLRLEKMPLRIECVDNSNISGTHPVSALVAFAQGRPDKSGYRKYRIKSVGDLNDDYACMAEVLKRRYGKGEASEPFPDLLLVDGGKGQLNIALAVMDELAVSDRFEVAAIAKKDEEKGETEDKIFRPGRSNPILFGRDRDPLFLLQRIRDEAHRFAITFHRKRRAKSALTSVLDDVKGIGKKRKTALLRHFGSLRKIREATVEELGAVPGMNDAAARTLKATLGEGDGPRQRPEPVPEG